MDTLKICDICMKHTVSINNPAPVLASNKNCCDDCNGNVITIRDALIKLKMDWRQVKVLTHARACQEGMVPDTRKNNGKLW